MLTLPAIRTHWLLTVRNELWVMKKINNVKQEEDEERIESLIKVKRRIK